MLGSSRSFVCVRPIPVRKGRRVPSCALGPFPFALGFVQVRSVHSRAHRIFVGCVRSIPVRPRFIRVRREERRPRSVHLCAPFGSSGAFGCVRSIPVRRRVVSVDSRALWVW